MTASPTTSWAGCMFSLACQWAKIVQPRTRGDDMRDRNPTFSCCLARVAIPCQVKQPETAPPSGSKRSFFPLLSLPLLIEKQRWNLEHQISEVWGTHWCKKMEIYLRQKSRFWSVHACLNIFNALVRRLLQSFLCPKIKHANFWPQMKKKTGVSRDFKASLKC